MNVVPIKPCPWLGWVKACFALTLIGLLCACANSPTHLLQDIPPLKLDDQIYSPAEVEQLLDSTNLLALDNDMREFVEQHVASISNQRQRLRALHRSLKENGAHAIEYVLLADGSAQDAFHRQSANCLSYAHLFVALAREAGLKANYQWIDIRPQWNRVGEIMTVSLHVNVRVTLSNRERYVVDIDPLEPWDIVGSEILSDEDASALHHNNLAMNALAKNDLKQAWLNAVRAVQLSPQMSNLWANLGVVYRHAGQYREAESSYLHALKINSNERSAMNNLITLYGLEGRETDHQYWQGRIKRYREKNPYFHTWHGDKAAENEDWAEALSFYKKALKLKPKDSHLLYSVGMLHYRLEDYSKADNFISEAIDHAEMVRDIESYKAQLVKVQQAQLNSQD